MTNNPFRMRALLLPMIGLAVAVLLHGEKAQADLFYLSPDRAIEGILISEDSRSVSFELDGAGVWTLSRKSLYRIERENPGAYWIRTGDRHLERERIEEARNAYQSAQKDPQTRQAAEDRLRNLDETVVNAEQLEKAIEEDVSHRPVEEVVEEPTPAADPIESAVAAQPRSLPEAPVSGIVRDRKWADHVRKSASEFGVDPLLVRAIIEVESKGNPKATSRSGAKGLMQLMPQTASALGVRDPYNPEQNIRGGAKYLGHLMKQFSHIAWPDRMAHVAAAYNVGPNRVKDVGDYRRIPAASRYADKVMRVYEKLREAASNDEVAFVNEGPGY